MNQEKTLYQRVKEHAKAAGKGVGTTIVAATVLASIGLGLDAIGGALPHAGLEYLQQSELETRNVRVLERTYVQGAATKMRLEKMTVATDQDTFDVHDTRSVLDGKYFPNTAMYGIEEGKEYRITYRDGSVIGKSLLEAKLEEQPYTQ